MKLLIKISVVFILILGWYYLFILPFCILYYRKKGKMNNCNDNKPCFNYPKTIICIGPTGSSDTIMVNSTATAEPGYEAKVIDTKVGNTHKLDFVIPRWYDGTVGPTGPANSSIFAAYLVTFNDLDNAAEGIIIQNGDRLPIKRLEIDGSNLVTLNNNDETIKFNKAGYYKIAFTTSASIDEETVFDPKKDFVALGFRKIDTDNIYIGASKWIYDGRPTQLLGQGIIAVEDTNNLYELVNVSKRNIKLIASEIEN